jgi:hypothetical protein
VYHSVSADTDRYRKVSYETSYHPVNVPLTSRKCGTPVRLALKMKLEATDQFEFRSTRRKKRSNVSHRRLTEEAAVFSIELRSAFVADLKSGTGRIKTMVQHQAPC